jgi:hypothetical protein
MRSSDTCSKADLDAGMCLAQAACPFPMPGGSADQGCMQSLFGAWSSVDNGWATGFGDGGWPLLPTAPCVVTTGGLDLADAGAATDYYGVKRGSKPAMGAAEVAPGACTP